MKLHKYCLLLVLAASAAALGGAIPAHAGLLINQRSNGLPGKPADEIVPQRLFVGAGAMRLNDLRPDGRYVVVDLQGETFREIDPKLHMYTEQGFQAVRDKRDKAEREREAAREQAVERLEGAELQAWLRRKGLRADGKRLIATEHLGPERIGHYDTEHLRITLNGKVMIDLWTTRDITEYSPPAELFDLYDKVGLFADDVIAALRAVEGFPVRIHADIDFFSAGTTLHTEVQSVNAWPEDRSVFQLPKGFRLAANGFPEISSDPAQVVSCVHCSAEIEHPTERVPGTGEYVCSRECLLEYIKSLRGNR